MKDRIVMKYRLYGLDGISNYEKQQLIEWKILKPLEHLSLKKVKKRVTKEITNVKGEIYEYSEDMSGSNESCYSIERM